MSSSLSSLSSSSPSSISSVIMHVFESGIRAQSRSSLDDLIRNKLEMSAREVAGAPPTERKHADTDTLVTAMGEYLTNTAQMWSRLTENLVQGSHMESAVHEAHEHAHKTSRSSNLDTVVAMDVEMTKLCKIRKLTEQFSHDVQAVWRPDSMLLAAQSPYQKAAMSPFPNGTDKSSAMPSPSTEGRGSLAQSPSRSTQLSFESSPAKRQCSTSDDEDDEDEKFDNIDMEALKQRGKGSYYCPKGIRCDKGGVDKQGKLVRFDRNSSFAQHCNKHRKPWRCEIPGCPNPPKKRKFARRDGLERHKSTVKHSFMK